MKVNHCYCLRLWVDSSQSQWAFVVNMRFEQTARAALGVSFVMGKPPRQPLETREPFRSEPTYASKDVFILLIILRFSCRDPIGRFTICGAARAARSGPLETLNCIARVGGGLNPALFGGEARGR